jgi:hypothetical protein
MAEHACSFAEIPMSSSIHEEWEHRAYINKYLHLSTSVSDERLRDRISYWFHGRWVHLWSFQREALILNPSSHRFTADLIELLLCAPPGSPHRILSALVHSLTGFNLTDATDLEEGEPPITIDIRDQIMHYGQVVGDKILEHRTCSPSSAFLFLYSVH